MPRPGSHNRTYRHYFQSVITQRSWENLFLDLSLSCKQGWSDPAKGAGPRPCWRVEYWKPCCPRQGLDAKQPEAGNQEGEFKLLQVAVMKRTYLITLDHVLGGSQVELHYLNPLPICTASQKIFSKMIINPRKPQVWREVKIFTQSKPFTHGCSVSLHTSLERNLKRLSSDKRVLM